MILYLQYRLKRAQGAQTQSANNPDCQLTAGLECAAAPGDFAAAPEDAPKDLHSADSGICC